MLYSKVISQSMTGPDDTDMNGLRKDLQSITGLFPVKYAQECKNYENHLNKVMWVFLGKLSLSTFR